MPYKRMSAFGSIESTFVVVVGGSLCVLFRERTRSLYVVGLCDGGDAFRIVRTSFG